jgi:hypothetical protein
MCRHIFVFDEGVHNADSLVYDNTKSREEREAWFYGLGAQCTLFLLCLFGDAFGYKTLLSKIVNMVDGSLGVREGAWRVHKRFSFVQPSTHGMVVALIDWWDISTFF